MLHSSHNKPPQTSLDRAAEQKRLTLALVLVIVYMLAELRGGLMTGSLALLADAGHMLSDAASLALALFALWLARRPAPPKHTWGYYRTEILAALANGAVLVAIAIFIISEAYDRFLATPQIDSGPMILIAAGGLAVNVIGLLLLRRGSSLNIRGAWLHVLTDTFGSIQAMTAGILIWFYGWYWVDPLASVLIAVLVIYSSWNLLKESVIVLMESSPPSLDVDEVKQSMGDFDDVLEVHDLHIWTITSGLVALSAHLVCRAACDRDTLLAKVGERVRDRFHISHTAIQIESQRYREAPPPI